MPTSSLKTDFTNIPAGTKVTVGSILFGMLDLPEEVVATEAAPGGAGEQLQTKSAAGPAATANGGGAAPSEAKASAKANGKKQGAQGGGGEEAPGDAFSRIDIRVGRITKVRGVARGA